MVTKDSCHPVKCKLTLLWVCGPAMCQGSILVMCQAPFWSAKSYVHVQLQFSPHSIPGDDGEGRWAAHQCSWLWTGACLHLKDQPRGKAMETGQSQEDCSVRCRWFCHKKKAIKLSLGKFYHISASDQNQNAMFWSCLELLAAFLFMLIP